MAYLCHLKKILSKEYSFLLMTTLKVVGKLTENVAIFKRNFSYRHHLLFLLLFTLLLLNHYLQFLQK